MTQDDGVIGIDRRFTTIEGMLRVIDAKLDRKVDRDEFGSVLRRVELLESGDTPLGKYMIKQFEVVQDVVNEVARNGSPNAQEALSEVTELRRTVEQIVRDNNANRAVVTNNQDRMVRTIRYAGLLAAGLSASGWLYTVITAAPHH